MTTQSLLQDCVWTAVSGYTAAGTSAVTSAIIDMTGQDGVIFAVNLATLSNTGVVTMEIYGNTVNSTGGMVAIPTTLATYTATGSVTLGIMAVLLYRPLKRYLEVIVTPSVETAVICGITAVQWKGRTMPQGLITNFLAYALATGV